MRLIDADAIKYDFSIKTYADNHIIVTSLLADKDTIDAMPTIEPSRWIPCSERLPEKGLRVLMYLNNAWQIVGWYDKEDKQWYALPFGQEVFNGCVLAWMPLPDAYKEDK